MFVLLLLLLLLLCRPRLELADVPVSLLLSFPICCAAFDWTTKVEHKGGLLLLFVAN